MLFSLFSSVPSETDVIIPVPLHNKRLKFRGFNQVQEILRPLCKSKQIIIADLICKRTHNTKPQACLRAKWRKRNLQGAFKITKKIAYDHIAILDDVFTTGSTVQALSMAFRDAGVSQIDVWCICRA